MTESLPAFSEARLAQTLQESYHGSALPALSRCLSSLCKPKGGVLAPKGQRAAVEWVGGAERWRFRPTQEPSRQEVREAAATVNGAGSRVVVKPKSCSQPMHPVTAARWDMRAKSESDLVLKKFGYFPGQPRQRGHDCASRLSEFLPATCRAYSGGSVLGQRAVKAAPSASSEDGRSSSCKAVELKTMSDIRVLQYKNGQQQDRLIVKRWRSGYADKAVAPRVVTNECRGAEPHAWQNSLRTTVCDNLVTFGHQ
eukprot:gb/GFBE01004172.1/.p1 GENE.gb/GFBE01004172.1/~~gb/GFBE01004172.1/.p1  ORF type:complete len:254 (+),score=30.44 gb/GFBE01004172.1/:1-762(+)